MSLDAFDDYASNEVLDLERGMILLAQDQYPSLRGIEVRAALDALAEGAPHIIDLPAERAAVALSAYLHAECGFHGNTANYGDPRNSFLNDVLTRRTGIPITLSLVWMLVGGRLGLPVQGVAFPGHFLVRVERENLGGPVVMDPFNGGRVLKLADLQSLLEEFAGPAEELKMAHLDAANARIILVRVLQNLLRAHLAKGDKARALIIAMRTFALLPDASWALLDRGLLQAEVGSATAARVDLLRYLEREPDSKEIPRARQALAKLDAKPRLASN